MYEQLGFDYKHPKGNCVMTTVVPGS